MAKNYYLDKSPTTGWWDWECKDGSGVGSAATKSAAKSEAKKACGGNYIISPPNTDVRAYRGFLSSFKVKNLDGKNITFSVGEISENEFSFYFGLPCASIDEVNPARKAVTILKIWGLYRGGINIEKIKTLHYLSDSDFDLLINRQYSGLHITIQDNGKISWKFPVKDEKTK